MDILALGALGAYSTYKSYKSKNGGKFYSAPETKTHYDNISAEFETYSKLAEALIEEMDAIATTDSYQGQDADGVKQLMSTTEPETLRMILDLHEAIEQYFVDVIDTFTKDVDSSSEAFLGFDMLDLIKQDFWEMLNDYNTEAKIAKEKIEEYSNKYSGKYNHTITIPDFSPGKDDFIALCGEADGDGADDYLSKCQKMLVDFDEAMATHLADLNLMDLVDAINQKLVTSVTERYPDSGLEQYVGNIDKFEKEYNYAKQFFTGDDAVDCQIINILLTYGHDLSSFDDVSWEEMSVERRKAYANITQVDIEYIDGHLSNEKCAEQEARLEVIIGTVMLNDPDKYRFDDRMYNSEAMKELESYMTSDTAKVYIDELSNVKPSEHMNGQLYDYPGGTPLNIRIDGVGVVFEYNFTDYNNTTEEILCHTSIDRTKACIDYWKKQNPDCYKYASTFLSDDQIVAYYCTAKTSGDVELIDNLMKNQGDYQNVFVIDPNKLSEFSSFVMGDYGVELRVANKGDEYNTYLSQISSVQYTVNGNVCTNEYIGLYASGSAAVSDLYLASAWASSENDGKHDEADLSRRIQIANDNELIGYTLYHYKNEVEWGTQTVQIDIDHNFLYIDKYDCDGNKINSKKDIITISHDSGNETEKDITSAELYELEQKKADVMRGIAVDLTVDLVKDVYPILGEGVSLLKDAFSEDYDGVYSTLSGKVGEDGSALKMGAGASSSIISNLVKYSEKIQAISDKQEEELENFRNKSLWYSVNYYDVVGGSKSYYAKIDDLNMIRMIQNWNENGLEGIYNQDFCDKMSRHESTLVNMICEDLDVSSSEQREQVEAAVSIFIHGNEDGNNLYYTSVTEIPVDLMLKCVTRADDIIKNNNEKFGNDYASVEDQIESYR